MFPWSIDSVKAVMRAPAQAALLAAALAASPAALADAVTDWNVFADSLTPWGRRPCGRGPRPSCTWRFTMH